MELRAPPPPPHWMDGGWRDRKEGLADQPESIQTLTATRLDAGITRDEEDRKKVTFFGHVANVLDFSLSTYPQ